MRLRFSLSTFLVLVALLAGFCYCWFVLPVANANEFVQAIGKQDYEYADELLPSQFIVNSSNQYWAYKAQAFLQPVTIGELLSGQRSIRLQQNYFHLDRNVTCFSEFRSTPFGLRSTGNSSVNEGMLIDQRSATPTNIR